MWMEVIESIVLKLVYVYNVVYWWMLIASFMAYIT